MIWETTWELTGTAQLNAAGKLLTDIVVTSGRELWLVAWLTLWSVWDLCFRKICLWQVILVMVTGLLWQGVTGNLFTVAGIGGILLGLVAWAFSFLTRNRFGQGDAMAILCLGLYLGFGTGLAALMWGLLIASIISLYLLWIRKKSRQYAIPFIPCLLAGCLLVIL